MLSNETRKSHRYESEVESSKKDLRDEIRDKEIRYKMRNRGDE